MADEKIVLEVDTSALTKGVEEATAKLIVMKNSLAILDNALKSGNISIEDYARKSAALKAEITATSQQQSAQARVLTQYVQANKAAEGSVDQLKATLAILSSQYNAMSQEERENTEAGKKLTQQVKEINEALKDAGAEVGDFRRNVGNYTGSILQAVDGTGLLATVTENLEGAQKAYNATLTVMKAGLGGNISMLKLFKLALAATGIGAVVLVLGGLVSFLTRTQEGIDFVSRSTKGFTTALGFLTDKLSDVGKKVFDAFSNPKQAIIDLVDLIQTNLLNRLKSFAVILEGIQKRDFTKLSDGLFQLSTGVTDMSKKTAQLGKELAAVAASGADVEREFQRIREAERTLNVERSKSRAEIERLKFLSEDVNKSESERIAAAEKAYAMEQSFLARAVKLQTEKVENMKVEMSLTKSSAADKDKLAEEQQKLNELQEESFGRQTELNNKINELRAAGLARQTAAMKEALEVHKELIQMELDQAAEGSEQQLRLRQDLIRKQLEIDNLGAEVSLERRKLNEKKANAELEKIRQEYFDRMEIKYREFIFNKIGPLTDKDVKKQMEATQKLLDDKDEATKKRIALIEEETAKTAMFIDGVNQVFSNSLTEQGLNLQEFSKGVLLLVLDTLEKQMTAQVAASIASATAQSMAQLDSVTTFGATGIARSLVLGGLIKAAFSVAKVGISAALSSDSPKYFAQGGIVDGPSHANGGVKYYSTHGAVELEGGEAVINRNSTSKYKELLSAINVAGGGKPLSLRGFMAAGGLTAAPAPVFPNLRNPMTGFDYKQLAREMSKVQIVTKVSDVQNGLNKAKMKQGKTDI